MKNRDILYVAGGLLLIIGAIFGIDRSPWSGYVYLAGAVIYTLCFLLLPHKEMDVRGRRLARFRLFSGILFIASAAYRLLTTGNLWIAIFALAMVFMIYAAILQVAQNKHKGSETSQ